MSIYAFLKEHHSDIEEIILSLKGEEFSSHDFIKKFSYRFEEQYIEMLFEYKSKGQAFQKVHGQLARYLSENLDSLPLVKLDIRPSENIFGNIDEVHWWRRKQ